MTETKKPSPVLHFALWTILGLVVIGFVLSYFFSGLKQEMRARSAEPALPVNSTVPAFTLTERSGKPFSTADLKGKIWIADFIFTTCPASCKTMTLKMHGLQTALASNPEIKLVSFTVDPEADTPEVLSKYADAHQANPAQWFFLTGPAQSIYDIAHKGFYLGFQKTTGEASIQFGKYTHSTQFALVDSQGRVRAYHDALDANMVQNVMADIEKLKREDQ